MSMLSDRIRSVLAIDPAAPAVEYEGHWHSWGELAAVVAGLDKLLGGAVPAGTPVGVLLRNSPPMVGVMLGIIAGERCIVTVNPHQGDAKLCADVRELRVPVLVAHDQDWARPGFREAAQETGALGLKLVADAVSPVRLVPGLEHVGSGPHRPVSPGVAVEMLTSGTTGTPKRVQLNYASFERTIAAAGEHYRTRAASSEEKKPALAKGVAIVAAPFVHMSGLFRTLLNMCEGRRIALLERFRVEPWLDLVRRYRPKAVALVPAALAMVLEADVAREDLSSVQVVTSGSAKLDPDTQVRFEEKYGIPVLPSYGATEFAGGVAGWTLPLHREWGERKRGSAGRPQPGREIRIVDAQTGAPVATDGIGLLEIRSGGTWVRTTDLGRVDADGFLWITGRTDDAILRGGFKIMPADVVQALRRHPAVLDASVVGLADARLGQVPAAAVELRTGAKVAPEELLEFMRQHLSAYQMPTQVLVVDALPRTPSMKVSQPAVRELFASSGARA